MYQTTVSIKEFQRLSFSLKHMTAGPSARPDVEVKVMGHRDLVKSGWTLGQLKGHSMALNEMTFGGLLKYGYTPKSSILNMYNRIFHYKPSILGDPPFQETPISFGHFAWLCNIGALIDVFLCLNDEFP